MAASSIFSPFCFVSLLLLLLRVLFFPGKFLFNLSVFDCLNLPRVCNCIVINTILKKDQSGEIWRWRDSMGLLPFGSAAGIGSFGLLSQCDGPRPTPTVGSAEVVGVCYGSMGNNLPEATEVIQLYKSNGIKLMRIYNPDKAILNALQGSNIDVVVGIPNTDLQSIVNLSSATNWVQRNIRAYVPRIKFRYIAVGNEVLPSDSFASYVLPAMRNIYNAIEAANLQDQIKVSTAISIGLLGSSFPPSAGSFSSKAREFIEPIVCFLAKNGSPLLANVYPYFAYIANPRAVNLDYALFRVDQDGRLKYHNLFEAIVDALYAALEKSGGANVSIVVSESGWPSGGGNATTVENEVAGNYYRSLIKFVRGGTPRRPERAIETYLFAMFDENMRPSEVEKHFGLFTPDKQPKYQFISISLSIGSKRLSQKDSPVRKGAESSDNI